MGFFNTFTEVASWYVKTPVVRSAWGKTYDIRPVGQRDRPWERIIKISDDCYVLSDGWHEGVLDVYRARYKKRPPKGQPTVISMNVEETLAHAPIIWRRGVDGVETLEVRNCGWKSNSPNTRHPFLTMNLPREMSVRNAGAALHALEIKQGSGNRDIYLPQVTSTRNETLTFFRGSDGFWQLPENARPVPVRRVDKGAKAPYVAAIREFHNWAKLMLPMLPINDFVATEEARGRIGFGWHHGIGRGVKDAGLILQILVDPEHPLRVDLAMSLYSETTKIREQRNREMPKNLMRPLNSWLGWNTTQERSF